VGHQLKRNRARALSRKLTEGGALELIPEMSFFSDSCARFIASRLTE
jgi:hypothetical protein